MSDVIMADNPNDNLSRYDKNVFAELIEKYNIGQEEYNTFCNLIKYYELKSKNLLSAFEILKKHNDKYTSKAYSFPIMILKLSDFLPVGITTLCFSLIENVNSCVREGKMVPQNIIFEINTLKEIYQKIQLFKNNKYILNSTNIELSGKIATCFAWIFENRNPIGFTKEEQKLFLKNAEDKKFYSEDLHSPYRRR